MKKNTLFAVWTFPVFLSPFGTYSPAGDEAFHWHRMSEERQVATLSGRCRRHDESLGQLVALPRSCRLGWTWRTAAGGVGSPPVRSVGACSRGLAGGSTHSDTRVLRPGEQGGSAVAGTVVLRHSRGEVLLRTGWGRLRSLWVSPRSCKAAGHTLLSPDLHCSKIEHSRVKFYCHWNWKVCSKPLFKIFQDHEIRGTFGPYMEP